MNPQIKIDKLSFILFTALLILAILIFLPVLFSEEKRTITSSAQEGWKCPGPNCDKCGCQGFWGAQCTDFCTRKPGDSQCGCKNPNLQPTNTPIPTTPASNPTPTTPLPTNPSTTNLTPRPTTSPAGLFSQLMRILYSASHTTSTSNPNTVSPTIDPNNYPTLTNAPDGSLTNLESLFAEIETKVGVPSKIMKAVSTIESPNILNLSSAQVTLYSQPGNTIPGCGPNVCSAAGPMQMTTGIDNKGSSSCSSCCVTHCLTSCPNAWSVYGNAVNSFNSPSHNPNACNLRDSVYAAAVKLKNDSRATSLTWTQDQVYRSAAKYYGSCANNLRYERLGNRTYCEFVWWYYTLGN